MIFAGGRNMALNKIREHSRILTDEKVDLKHVELDLNLSEEASVIPRKFFYKKLTIKRFPYFFWLIALIFISLSFLILYNVLTPANSKLFNVLEGKSAWEYGVIVLAFVIGISFLVVAKYEKIELDKEKDLIIYSKFFLFCCKFKKIYFSVKSVNAIYPVVVSHSSNSGESKIFKIGLRFNEKETFVFFKSLFGHFVIKDVITLRSYIFEKKDSYESVENELRINENFVINV